MLFFFWIGTGAVRFNIYEDDIKEYITLYTTIFLTFILKIKHYFQEHLKNTLKKTDGILKPLNHSTRHIYCEMWSLEIHVIY